MSMKLTQEQFTTRAKEIHGDNRYDYSKVEYVGALKKVTIICTEHGEFEQLPSSHLNGRGCRKCARESTGASLKLTQEEFIQKAKSAHNNTYDYSKVQYVNAMKKVIIICSTHGDFEQIAGNHLNGQGCPKCGRILTSESNKLTQEEFIKRAKSAHGDRYDYSRVDYVNALSKVVIICSTHGEFLQAPNSHISGGQGCPHCANENSGWNRTAFVNRCESKDGIGTLYVIECYNENEKFIKFGITSNTIEKRYSSKYKMPYSYRVLAECTGTPETIWNIEKGLKREMRLSHYVPQIVFGGHLTECFIRSEE